MKKSVLWTVSAVFLVSSVYAGEVCESDQRKILELEAKIAELEKNIQQGTSVETEASLDQCWMVRNRHTIPVGTRCRTHEGAIFQRVSDSTLGGGWKAPDGMFWSDSIGNYPAHIGALTCIQLGGSMVSIESYREGRRIGIEEIVGAATHVWALKISRGSVSYVVHMPTRLDSDYVERAAPENFSYQVRCHKRAQ